MPEDGSTSRFSSFATSLGSAGSDSPSVVSCAWSSFFLNLMFAVFLPAETGAFALLAETFSLLDCVWSALRSLSFSKSSSSSSAISSSASSKNSTSASKPSRESPTTGLPPHSSPLS